MRTKQRKRKERGCDETGRYAGSPTDAATVTAVTNSNNTQHLKDKTKEGTQINIAIALCVCVCACVCAHVCTCVCAHVCVRPCERDVSTGSGGATTSEEQQGGES